VERCAIESKPFEYRFFVRGDVDDAGAVELQVDLDEAIGMNNDDLVVDCCGLTSIEPSGLMVLLRTRQTLRELGRKLRVVNADDTTERLIDQMGLVD
jgi:anti-anti-sigma factor